jgi:hypothetical protein
MSGGDTAQREGWYWFGVWIRQNVLHDPWTVPRKLAFEEVLLLLEPKQDGVFYRHPKLPPWNNPYDKDYGFSRDQMVPLIAAMGAWSLSDPKFYSPLRRLWNALPEDQLGGTKHTFNGKWWPGPGLWWPRDKDILIFTGDIVGPATINFYRRALRENPMKASDGNGPNGERELAANVVLRLEAAATDKDDTGDDLNLIVILLLAILQFPSTDPIVIPPLPLLPTLSKLPNFPIPPPEWHTTSLPPLAVLKRWFPSDITTDLMIKAYKQRPLSYGSYLGAYRKAYGIDFSVPTMEVFRRMNQGIQDGWNPDAKGVYGAVRWYHREESGANPMLAELYAPIIRAYLE